MGVNADQMLAELLAERGVDGAIFAKLEGRPPDHPLPARWLRRLSLDELPQLLNVLLGAHVAGRPPAPGGRRGRGVRRGDGPPPAREAGHDRAVAGLGTLRPLRPRRDPPRRLLRGELVDAPDLSILFRTPLAVLGARGAY